VDCKKGFPQIIADLGSADKKEIVQGGVMNNLGGMEKKGSRRFSQI
jgi:hypothetical protein